jgi:preprotein translocase subunit YajC
MIFNTLLLQAQANNTTAWLFQFLFFGGILLIMYLFFILPQQKKQKEQTNFRNSLKVGDDVITIGGMHGKIAAIDEEKGTITIQADKNTKLVFDKFSISMEASRRLQTKS